MTAVFVTREIPGPAITMLRARGYEVDVYDGKTAPSPRALKKMLSKKPYEAIVSLLTDRIDDSVLAVAPSVRIVANYAIGYDNIDLDAAGTRKVVVTNTPGDYAYTVAEHALALMLALSTRLVEADAFVRSGRYRGWSPSSFIGTDIRGKTLGLVGMGRIGEHLARIARHGLGLSIIYYDVRRNERAEKECGAQYVDTVDALVSQADIVSLHVPLTPDTHHLIDARRLARMKPGALLINTSRGPVVDESALVHALSSGALGGAGLDVFEHEPRLARGLSKLSNVVLTPHIASARRSAREEMSKIVAENIIAVLEGRKPLNPVQPQS